MLTSFFDWIRRRTSAAIMAGVEDAAAEIDQETASTDAAVKALGVRLTERPALELENGTRRKARS